MFVDRAIFPSNYNRIKILGIKSSKIYLVSIWKYLIGDCRILSYIYPMKTLSHDLLDVRGEDGAGHRGEPSRHYGVDLGPGNEKSNMHM